MKIYSLGVLGKFVKYEDYEFARLSFDQLQKQYEDILIHKGEYEKSEVKAWKQYYKSQENLGGCVTIVIIQTVALSLILLQYIFS